MKADPDLMQDAPAMAAGRTAPLRTEAQVMRGWNAGTAGPLVSICCATHNHAAWIEDALRGFLAQETTFPFEIIVRDDASTDGTTAIVRRYAEQYPAIIRPLLNEQNRYAVGERPSHVWPTVARGRFIAFCEGDDYWISPSKLQKQVDLLERHPEAVMCVAYTHRVADGASRVFSTVQPEGKVLLHTEDVHASYYHTSSYLIRSDIFAGMVQRFFLGHTSFGDGAMRAILVSMGPFVLLPEFVSVYRVTGQGVWTSLDLARRLKWEYAGAMKLGALLPGKHGRRQRNRLYGISLGIMKAHAKGGSLLAALRWAPRVVYYGVLRIPVYLSNKLGRR